MTKFTLTDLIMGFLCLCIYLPFLVIGMAVFAVAEAIRGRSATKGNEHE